MHRLAKIYDDGKTNTQISDNSDVVDWVYVRKVVTPHFLTAGKLDSDSVAGHVFFITTIPC